jgi:hypothetical protein
MNMVDENAIVDLDQAISDGKIYPVVVSVGYRLFEALCLADRLQIGPGLFGYSHFVLDQNVNIYADLSVSDWGFRLHFPMESATG